MIDIEGLTKKFGPIAAVAGIDLKVSKGEVLGFLGPNGAGKSTTMKILCGLLAPASGSVRLRGAEIGGLPAYAVARRGVAYVPEDRQVFSNLTTKENLAIAAMVTGAGKFSMRDVFDIFPQLAAKSGTLGENLSGGEQQMLSIARALIGNPSVVLMDEPSEGLAPVIVEELARAMKRLAETEGLTLLLVEQNIRLALAVSRRTAVMDRGRIVYDGASETLKSNPEMLERLIGVSKR